MIKGFKALPGAQKVLWGFGILLAPLFIISAVSPTPDMQKAAQVNQATEISVTPQTENPENLIPAPQAMKAETKTVTETVALPYQSVTQDDVSLEAGKTVVAVTGVNGEKEVAFEVTYLGGAETARKQVGERVTKAPINEVKKVGTKAKKASYKPVASKCHSSYEGVCVPIAADVDCSGGSGNGPAFVSGPLRVVGFDVYHLDGDHNGVGCE
jgi:hypothetical protein